MKLLLNLALLFLGTVSLIGAEVVNTPSVAVSLGTTKTAVVKDSTEATPPAEDYSVYKSYYKKDHKVVVTSPGFWNFPSQELTTVRFDVSAPNGYNSSEDMITEMEQEASQSGESNTFKAVLQFNRELDITFFNNSASYIENTIDNSNSAVVKILGLYYYLVEQDQTCDPSAYYSGSIAYFDEVNYKWISFNYPYGVHLKSNSIQTGYSLDSYNVDLTYNTSNASLYKETFVTLYDIYSSSLKGNDTALDYGQVSNAELNTIQQELVQNCQSYQEEIGNLSNRELTDTETIELDGGISVENKKYAKGNLEDMIFSFTTPAPLDWENIGLSIEFDINTESCIMPLPSEEIVSQLHCNWKTTSVFNNSFGREDISLMSDPSGNEHKLRLFFKNVISDSEYENLSNSFDALSLNAQYSGSGKITIKLHAVDAVETQDGDDNTIFNTGNGATLHEWTFELKGNTVMIPTQEKVN